MNGKCKTRSRNFCESLASNTIGTRRSLQSDPRRSNPILPSSPWSWPIEVKFANDRHLAAAVQRELAEDVTAYKTKWKHLLAVVYDLGVIQDPEQMKRENEAHFGVTVVIVKH